MTQERRLEALAAFVAAHEADHGEITPENPVGGAPLTHGGIVGQVWRGGTGRQANLARLMPGLEVSALDDALDVARVSCSTETA